jgi:hypothetical protein
MQSQSFVCQNCERCSEGPWFADFTGVKLVRDESPQLRYRQYRGRKPVRSESSQSLRLCWSWRESRRTGDSGNSGLKFAKILASCPARAYARGTDGGGGDEICRARAYARGTGGCGAGGDSEATAGPLLHFSIFSHVRARRRTFVSPSEPTPCHLTADLHRLRRALTGRGTDSLAERYLTLNLTAQLPSSRRSERDGRGKTCKASRQQDRRGKEGFYLCPLCLCGEIAKRPIRSASFVKSHSHAQVWIIDST